MNFGLNESVKPLTGHGDWLGNGPMPNSNYQNKFTVGELGSTKSHTSVSV